MNDRNELVAAILSALAGNQTPAQPTATNPTLTPEELQVTKLLTGTDHMKWTPSDRELIRRQIAETLKGL